MKELIKKELLFYFNNPIGYIVSILFAVCMHFLFVKDLFVRADGSMRYFFDLIPWVFLIFIPAVSMRIFAEEKRTHTLEVLLSLPMSETAIVLSKLIALAAFVVISLLLTISIPATLYFISTLAISEVIVGYLGVFMLAFTFLTISIFFSSLSTNQIVAFLSSTLTLFLLILIGEDFLTTVFPQSISSYLVLFSPITHYEQFLKGLLDVRSLLYFLSLSAMCIFFTIITIERRG